MSNDMNAFLFCFCVWIVISGICFAIDNILAGVNGLAATFFCFLLYLRTK